MRQNGITLISFAEAAPLGHKDAPVLGNNILQVPNCRVCLSSLYASTAALNLFKSDVHHLQH